MVRQRRVYHVTTVNDDRIIVSFTWWDFLGGPKLEANVRRLNPSATGPKAYRKMDVTRERISRILELREIPRFLLA